MRLGARTSRKWPGLQRRRSLAWYEAVPARSAVATDPRSLRDLGQRDHAPADARGDGDARTTSASWRGSRRRSRSPRRPRTTCSRCGAASATTGARGMLHAGARASRRARRASARPRRAARRCPGSAATPRARSRASRSASAVGLVDGNVARVLARVFAIDDDMRRARDARAPRRSPTRSSARARSGRVEPGADGARRDGLHAAIARRAIDARRDLVPRARAKARRASSPSCRAKKKPEARERVAGARRDARAGRRAPRARREPIACSAGSGSRPSIEGAAGVRTLVARLALAVGEAAGSASSHVLSHRQLTVDVHAGSSTGRSDDRSTLPDGYEAPTASCRRRSSSELGIATLARKILAAARAMLKSTWRRRSVSIGHER